MSTPPLPIQVQVFSAGLKSTCTSIVQLNNHLNSLQSSYVAFEDITGARKPAIILDIHENNCPRSNLNRSYALNVLSGLVLAVAQLLDLDPTTDIAICEFKVRGVTRFLYHIVASKYYINDDSTAVQFLETILPNIASPELVRPMVFVPLQRAGIIGSHTKTESIIFLDEWKYKFSIDGTVKHLLWKGDDHNMKRLQASLITHVPCYAQEWKPLPMTTEDLEHRAWRLRRSENAYQRIYQRFRAYFEMSVPQESFPSLFRAYGIRKDDRRLVRNLRLIKVPAHIASKCLSELQFTLKLNAVFGIPDSTRQFSFKEVSAEVKLQLDSLMKSDEVTAATAISNPLQYVCEWYRYWNGSVVTLIGEAKIEKSAVVCKQNCNKERLGWVRWCLELCGLEADMFAERLLGNDKYTSIVTTMIREFRSRQNWLKELLRVESTAKGDQLWTRKFLEQLFQVWCASELEIKRHRKSNIDPQSATNKKRIELPQQWRKKQPSENIRLLWEQLRPLSEEELAIKGDYTAADTEEHSSNCQPSQKHQSQTKHPGPSVEEYCNEAWEESQHYLSKSY